MEFQSGLEPLTTPKAFRMGRCPIVLGKKLLSTLFCYIFHKALKSSRYLAAFRSAERVEKIASRAIDETFRFRAYPIFVKAYLQSS